MLIEDEFYIQDCSQRSKQTYKRMEEASAIGIDKQAGGQAESVLNEHDSKRMGASDAQYCRQEGSVTRKMQHIRVEGLAGEELVDSIVVVTAATIGREQGRQR